MARLVRSRRARQDLIDIWTFVAADSPVAADRLLDRVDAACQRLLDHPASGAAREDIRPGMRHLVIGPYLVLYRIAGTDIQVVRVVHGRRDLGRLD